MAGNNLIGREAECDRLSACVNAPGAQLAVIYGRRRVGKTFLINEFFNGEFAFRFTGEFDAPKVSQLHNFANELFMRTGIRASVPHDWKEAFLCLRTYLASLSSDHRQVVFFDEMPWMDTPNSHFLSEFEYFWNSWGSSQKNLLFVVCGSATSWLVDHIDHNKGGLFNRLTCRIYVEPFRLAETEQYLLSRGIHWARYDICECYMIMGGIPYYLSLLDPEQSYVDNIDRIFFRKHAELWNEFSQLYHTLFSSSENHIRVVEALSDKRSGLTREELSEATGLPQNGMLTRILRSLEGSGFVRMNPFYGKKKKNIRYQLADHYTLFYFRFLKDAQNKEENYWAHSIGTPSHLVWAGLSYELLCMEHIRQIKKKLDIAGVLSEQSTWYVRGDEVYDGAQIDLLIDRRDRVTNLCEIKFSKTEFAIDKDYDRALRNKVETFRRVTGSKNTLVLTMITTYGIKENKYSNTVGGRITMDDLFI